MMQITPTQVNTQTKPRVGLFVTCIVDIMRPNIGFAALKLLEQSGCDVEVPLAQTCCGQPAYNSGDNKNTMAIAKQVIDNFSDYDYLVAPSGSCAAMIKVHYPELFSGDQHWHEKASQLANKTHELTKFLVEVRDFKLPKRKLSCTITYHDSCSGYREMGVYSQPRKLLSEIEDLTLIEMKNSTECCGFGGTFCVKYSDISNAMVTDKSNAANDTHADILVGGDYGCLMNIAGKLNRENSDIKTVHVAELLADMIQE